MTVQIGVRAAGETTTARRDANSTVRLDREAEVACAVIVLLADRG